MMERCRNDKKKYRTDVIDDRDNGGMKLEIMEG